MTAAHKTMVLQRGFLPNSETFLSSFIWLNYLIFRSNDLQDQDCDNEPFPYFKVKHQNPSLSYGQGDTFMDEFDKDKYHEYCQSNLYFPFVSRMDWELVSFLYRSPLSMASINEFLSLELLHHFQVTVSPSLIFALFR